ncbi:hypothetical protein RB195_016778 [Necator americanus]|uniref:Uncharacterized protein n=1 Tax=Necator americanus TaxID=51031 RepID=A0ABR1C240_NECAM
MEGSPARPPRITTVVNLIKIHDLEEQQHIALQISKQMELKWEKNCNDQKQQQRSERAKDKSSSNKEQNCTSEKKTPIRIEPVAEPTTKKANPPGCSQTGTKKPKIPKALEDHNYAASPPDEEVNVPEETEKTKKSKNFVRTYATRPVRTYLKVRGEQARYYSGELELVGLYNEMSGPADYEVKAFILPDKSGTNLLSPEGRKA